MNLCNNGFCESSNAVSIIIHEFQYIIHFVCTVFVYTTEFQRMLNCQSLSTKENQNCFIVTPLLTWLHCLQTLLKKKILQFLFQITILLLFISAISPVVWEFSELGRMPSIRYWCYLINICNWEDWALSSKYFSRMDRSSIFIFLYYVSF